MTTMNVASPPIFRWPSRWRDRASGTLMTFPVVDLGSGTSAIGDQMIERAALRWEFEALRDQWKRETGGASSPLTISMNEAYQAVIGMGKDALPFILQDLDEHDGHWFWALRSIARMNPVTDAAIGDYRAMKQAWIDWGKQNGYLAR